MEVAPGIHRIEGDLGERYVCQYLLAGEERWLLVDTGLRDMPEQVVAPYLATLGRSLGDLDDVLISHADVDHCGGNRALRAAAPAARVLCGEADRTWIESNAAWEMSTSSRSASERPSVARYGAMTCAGMSRSPVSTSRVRSSPTSRYWHT